MYLVDNGGELFYLLASLIFSIIISLRLIIYKINFKNSSNISIIFALFFLVCYIFQPFLLALDYSYSLFFSYNNEVRNMKIDTFLKYEYKIVGWIGATFSNVILPLSKDYILSGYFTVGKKICDSIKRLFIKVGILLIVFAIFLILSITFFIIKGGGVYYGTKNLLDFILNILIIPGFLKSFFYLGSYFILLKDELRMEWNICRSENYLKRLVGIIKYYLDKDKSKLIEAYKNLKFISDKYLMKNTLIKKTYILNLVKKVENEQENLQVNLTYSENIECKINLNNYLEVLSSSIRNIKTTVYQIPRKIFVLQNISKKMTKKKCLFYCLVPITMIYLGIYWIFFELFSSHFKYSEIKSKNEIIENFRLGLEKIFLYFILAYYSVIKHNSITEQKIYGTCQSDTICLLNFSKSISGLITPLSFIALGTKYFGIFNNLRENENCIFIKYFNLPIIENIFITLTFKDVYFIYIFIRFIFILASFILSIFVHNIKIKGCCWKCKNYKLKFKVNDKNNKRFLDFSDIGSSFLENLNTINN